MTIKIPFCYKAQVIKSKCRKPVEVMIQDSVTVKIKKFSKNELPIAFRIEKDELLYDGKSLWAINYDNEPETREIYTVNSDTVIRNTEDGGENYRYSRSSPEAPFLNFWWDAKCLIEDNIKVPTKKELENDNKWISDDKNKIIKEIKEVAANLIFCDDILYKKAKEPMYVVQSFGGGHNYSVALSSTYLLNTNIDKKAYFNALDLEKAKAYAFSKTKEANIYGNIEVLIPEAVKFKKSRNK